MFTQRTHRGSPPLRFLLARSSWSGALALLLAISSGCSQKSATAPGAAASQSRVADSFHRQRFQGQQVHLEGRASSGALWEIDKPADWHGDLVHYLHG